jgi:hypothetical protein
MRRAISFLQYERPMGFCMMLPSFQVEKPNFNQHRRILRIEHIMEGQTGL